ncbi:MAG: hypothetical protein RLZ67_1223, partial [Actinomycetota bacterium]
MKRVALFLSAFVLAGCGASATSSTTSSTTSESVNTSVSYSTIEIGTIPSPVDLVERSPEDSWFYVVSQSGVIQKWSRDGQQRSTILDISEYTSVGGE